MTVEDVVLEAGAFQADLIKRRGQREAVVKQLETERTDREEAERQRKLYADTVAFLQAVLKSGQTTIQNVFNDLGSAAISKIFSSGPSDEKKLNFAFETRNRSLCVDIQLIEPWSPDGSDEKAEDKASDISKNSGGGLRDVASFALRMAMLELQSGRGMDGPVFLDEIFNCISVNNIHAAGEFLKELSKRTDRQILLITHQPVLLGYADRVFVASPGPNKTIRLDQQ
jgi:DNA repair exonuclease SbcCD ATPase subunit